MAGFDTDTSTRTLAAAGGPALGASRQPAPGVLDHDRPHQARHGHHRDRPVEDRPVEQAHLDADQDGPPAWRRPGGP